MEQHHLKFICRNSLFLKSETSLISKGSYTPDFKMKKNGRSSQLTLLYQAPIIQAKKSKNLNGPFDVLDVPDIREAIKKRFKNDAIRKKQDSLISHQFVEAINLNEYFENKSNWIDRSKFVNTYSLYTAMNTYLPNYKANALKLPIQLETYERDVFSLKKIPIKIEKRSRNYFDSESKVISSSNDWL